MRSAPRPASMTLTGPNALWEESGHRAPGGMQVCRGACRVRRTASRWGRTSACERLQSRARSAGRQGPLGHVTLHSSAPTGQSGARWGPHSASWTSEGPAGGSTEPTASTTPLPLWPKLSRGPWEGTGVVQSPHSSQAVSQKAPRSPYTLRPRPETTARSSSGGPAPPPRCRSMDPLRWEASGPRRHQDLDCARLPPVISRDLSCLPWSPSHRPLRAHHSGMLVCSFKCRLTAPVFGAGVSVRLWARLVLGMSRGPAVQDSGLLPIRCSRCSGQQAG